MNKTELLIAEALNADCWIKSETKFQECVARLLDGLGLLWFHPANERKCSPKQGAALKRKGVKAGVPDVIIFEQFFTELNNGEIARSFRWHGCAIELKYGKNRPTTAQLQWLYNLKDHLWYTDTAYSMKDVVAILARCGYVSV